MNSIYNKFDWFFTAGGPVLWLIFVVTIIMWTLIFERYWFIYRIHPADMTIALNTWKQRSDKHTWYAKKIREAIISKMSSNLIHSLHIIRMLVVICPLLGLLGTVTGMIHVFDVITVLGTGNPRAISSGISMATIPTMAGLVAALSGYYFSHRLKHKASIETQNAIDGLSISTT